LRGSQIPFARIGGIPTGLEIASEFKSHHPIACFGKEVGELPGGIFAGASSPDARGNLLPISHNRDVDSNSEEYAVPAVEGKARVERWGRSETFTSETRRFRKVGQDSSRKTLRRIAF
jgi:hypothetical protein